MAHLAYLTTFAIADPATPFSAALFAVPALLLFILAALFDGVLRHSILERTDPSVAAIAAADPSAQAPLSAQ